MDAIDAVMLPAQGEDVANTNENPNLTNVVLRYADIVELSAPRNAAVHGKMFVVDYIDETGAVLADANTGETYDLPFTESGAIRDESIVSISILSRADPPGYAATNGLLTGEWVDVYIGGDMPTTITGRISAVEQDMIEIAPFPTGEVFYVDFAYKGIPRNTPFEAFVLRDIPAAAAAALKATMGTPDITDADIDVNLQITETGEVPIQGPPTTNNNEMILNLPVEYVEDISPDANYTTAFVLDDLVFSDEIETVTRLVEISAKDNVYTIDAQLHSILDELIATVPEDRRTGRTLARIHSKVERFRELRELFSKFDEAGDIIGVRIPRISPIGDAVALRVQDMHWIVPITAGRKWLFDISETQDIIGDATLRTSTSAEAVVEISDISSTTTNPAHNYDRRIRAIASATTSFAEPIPIEIQNCFQPIRVNDRVESIVENVDTLSSAVVVNGKLSRAKFVANVFDSAPMVLHRDTTDRRKYNRVPIIAGDAMYIKAAISLSRDAVDFSRCWLPGTNMLEKADLAANTIYTFRELMLKKFNTGQTKGWGKYLRHAVPRIADLVGVEAYSRLITELVPTPIEAINLVDNKYSLVGITRELEVLQVYHEDFTQPIMQSVKKCVANSTKTLRQNILSARNFFGRNVAVIPVSPEPNRISQILETTEKAAGEFPAEYSSAAILRDMYDSVAGLKVLHAIIRRANIALRLPAEMMGELAQSYATVSSKPGAYDCARHILAKRYTSEVELAADNDRAAYFDADLDPTPYELAERYSRQGGSDAEYADFLAKALVRYHDAPASSATRAATAMVAKQRYIIDGEYASLSLQSQDLKQTPPLEPSSRYFVRKNDRWVHDASVDAMAFALAGALFCDIAAKCVRAGVTKDCVSAEEAHSSSIRSARAELDKRFDARMQEDRDTQDAVLTETLMQLSHSRAISLIKTRAANNFAYKLGTAVSPPTDEDTKLRMVCNSILSQLDITKRHIDIVRFVEHSAFCRMPILTVPGLDEDPHWIYGAETNSKILPSFIYDLARASLANTYATELDRVCAERGVVVESDIVDKYSGYVIKRVDDAVEDEFDEAGFRILTRAIMPVADTVSSTEVQILLENTVPEILDATDKVLQHMILVLCESLGANFEIVCNAALRIAKSAATAAIMPQDKYVAKVATLDPAARKSMPAYDIYFSKNAFYCAVAAVVVALQTAIPPITLGARMPGCIPSASGFPLDADETDLSTISFVICAARSSRAAFVKNEWAWLSAVKAGAAETSVHTIIVKYVLSGPDASGVADLYAAKRAYLSTRAAAISTTHAWPHFTPPINAIAVAATIPPRSDDLLAAFVRAITSGAPEQRAILAMIYQRAAMSSYAMIESIHATTTAASGTIHLSPDKLTTSCCHDYSQISTLNYFLSRDSRIAQYIAELSAIGAVIQDSHSLQTPPILFNTLASRPPEIPVATSGYARNAYAAIIRYCRLDSIRPIPMSLQFVIQERPAGYDPTWNHAQKISFLQDKIGTTTIKDAAILLAAVGAQNLVPIFSAASVVKSRFDAFLYKINNILAPGPQGEVPPSTHFAEKIIPIDLALLIRATIVAAEKQGPSVERSRELDALADYLVKANLDLRTDIASFVARFGTITGKTAREAFLHYIDTVDEWNTDMLDTSALFSGAQFLKNDIAELCNAIPVSAANSARLRVAPKHWDFAPKHVDDLAKYNADIDSDVQKASTDILIPILHTIPSKLRDIAEFAATIPVHAPTISPDNRPIHVLLNIQTTKLLLGWCWRTALYTYITTTTEASVSKNRDEVNMSVRSARIDMDTGVLDEDAGMQINTRALLVRHMAIFITALVFASNVRKRTAIINYAAIEADTRRAFAIDEKRITDRLAGDRSETSVQRVLKSFKLGEWAAGAQSSIYKYDKASYDNARFALAEDDDALAAEIDAEMDFEADIAFADMVSARDADAFEAEMMGDTEFREAAFEVDREYNMLNLRSDYYDGGGDYYDGDDDAYDE